MAEKLYIFEPRYMDNELEDEFQKFFPKYNLTPLFTNEHRAGSISVTYVDARSVIASSGHFSNVGGERVEHGGSYHVILKEFADFLSISNDNKSYEEALFRIIYKYSSFQGFMNYIKKHIEFITEQISQDHMWNLWNIVWYAEELK